MPSKNKVVKKQATNSKNLYKIIRLLIIVTGLGIVLYLATNWPYAVVSTDIKKQASSNKISSAAVNGSNKTVDTPVSGNIITDTPLNTKSSDTKSNSAAEPAAITPYVTITKVNVQNDPVSISALVGGFSSGTCYLTASLEGQPSVTAQNNVIAQTSYYSCENFSIPFSQFSVSGSWKFTVMVKSGTIQASNTWTTTPIYIQK